MLMSLKISIPDWLPTLANQVLAWNGPWNTLINETISSKWFKSTPRFIELIIDWPITLHSSASITRSRFYRVFFTGFRQTSTLFRSSFWAVLESNSISNGTNQKDDIKGNFGRSISMNSRENAIKVILCSVESIKERMKID